VIAALASTTKPVTAVDVPSSWDPVRGPSDGPGAAYRPAALVSMTAPKPCIEHFTGRHFVGGR
jgi:NAD(P)H-hydrate epimerase